MIIQLIKTRRQLTVRKKSFPPMPVNTHGAGEDRASYPPVWQRQLPDIDGTLGLGFLDLMEARFVDAFRKAGGCGA